MTNSENGSLTIALAIQYICTYSAALFFMKTTDSIDTFFIFSGMGNKRILLKKRGKTS
jgi:hypothetical protein